MANTRVVICGHGVFEARTGLSPAASRVYVRVRSFIRRLRSGRAQPEQASVSETSRQEDRYKYEHVQKYLAEVGTADSSCWMSDISTVNVVLFAVGGLGVAGPVGQKANSWWGRGPNALLRLPMRIGSRRLFTLQSLDAVELHH